ncbi:UNVERIFIED_CONTAM: Bet1-like SNARE 1-2 [Sesamum calycinum]|uniref:Bet1-like SNARE 1-2 n=1 Tax=Sesamum calycinum TaxID=2727403 RepID=A0AAW2QKQ9_9LAMI
MFDLLFLTTLSWILAIPRDHRSSRAALFDNMDSLEEGGLRSSSSYSSGIDDHDNEKTMDSLHDRVSFLKRLTGDINEEVESHNRMLDRMGNEMDASRGIMLGTIDRFKMVFEKKSSRRICKLAAYFVLAFFLLYYFIRILLYFMYG